jgi:hypothetical protein
MTAISFTLGANAPQRRGPGIYIRSSFPDAQLPAGLCADRFGGAMTAVAGCTKKLSRSGSRRERPRRSTFAAILVPFRA